MKAIVQRGYGGPEVLDLREVARPAAGEEEVLVRVRAASLHPDVWHMVRGRPYVLRLMGAGLRKPKNPIPGTDMAGVVAAVGRRVTRWQPGEEVFGETITRHQWTNGGAFAEYVAVRQEWVARKPTNVTFEQAAAVPTSGYITLLNFRAASRLRPGQRVLINGAGGGVGSLALQLAKAQGAHVTAVDGPTKLGLLRDLGADEVLDYTREDFTRREVRYDFILDVPGNRPFSVFRRVLDADGRYVPIGHESYGAVGKRLFGLIPHFLGLMIRARFDKQLRGSSLPAPSREEAMATLQELLATGKITPVIDSTYPLREAGEALRHMIEDDLRGKVILTVAEET